MLYKQKNNLYNLNHKTEVYLLKLYKTYTPKRDECQLYGKKYHIQILFVRSQIPRRKQSLGSLSAGINEGTFSAQNALERRKIWLY